MITKGIRILDKTKFVTVTLQDILSEISNGDQFVWSILYFYGDGSLVTKSIMDFESEIKNLEKGLILKWKDLNELADCFYDVWGILIIGCENKENIIRYETDKKMYETCDIVIEMIDSSYWEVFSKDELLLRKLTEKFNEMEVLSSDFQDI